MKIQLTALLMAVVIISCNTSSDPVPPPPVPECRLDSIRINNNGARIRYSNDKIVGFTLPGFDVKAYYDLAGKLIKRVWELDGGWTHTVEYTYDSNGFITVMTKEHSSSPSDGERARYELTYLNNKPGNAKRYIQEPGGSNYEYRGDFKYTWTNDNLTSTQLTDESGQAISTVSHDFDLGKSNTFFGFPEFSLIMMGAPDGENIMDAIYLSKNIMTRAKLTSGTGEYQFTYEYNNDNLIRKITVFDVVNNAQAATYEFFYECD